MVPNIGFWSYAFIIQCIQLLLGHCISNVTVAKFKRAALCYVTGKYIGYVTQVINSNILPETKGEERNLRNFISLPSIILSNE